jgi:hypothetical protein
MTILLSGKDPSLFDSFTRPPTPNDHHQKISGDGSGVLAMIRKMLPTARLNLLFSLFDRDQPVCFVVSAAGSEAKRNVQTAAIA